MKAAKFPVLIAALISLSSAACTSVGGIDSYLYRHAVKAPDQTRMMVCHGYQCAFKTSITLDPAILVRLDGLFKPGVSSTEEELRRIVLAVAFLEDYVGGINGTSADSPGYSGRGGNPTQLDCVDESTNGTVYLKLLQNRGLIRWHRVRAPVSRGLIVDLRWYHQGTVLVNLETRQRFVLDTWFRKNGQPGYVLPLAEWQAGDGIPKRSLTPL